MRACVGAHVEASAVRERVWIMECRGRRHVARQRREGVTLLTGWSNAPFMTAAGGEGRVCCARVVSLLSWSDVHLKTCGDKKGARVKAFLDPIIQKSAYFCLRAGIQCIYWSGSCLLFSAKTTMKVPVHVVFRAENKQESSLDFCFSLYIDILLCSANVSLFAVLLCFVF